MKFYKEFSKYYDYIFSFKKEKFDFLVELAPSKGKVLDVATGTGIYALALAQQGYEVTGIDLSEEMIYLAQNKVSNKIAGNIEFKVEDMKNLDTLFPQEKFDLIYCIGNSLVHLDNLSQISDVISQFYKLLSKNGKLVIQVVNYNRILKKGIKKLPTIENKKKDVKLNRNYFLDGDKVEFQTELHTPQGIYENSVLLYPLTVEELNSCLEKAGFLNCNFYGGFNKTDYIPDESFPLVVTAQK